MDGARSCLGHWEPDLKDIDPPLGVTESIFSLFDQFAVGATRFSEFVPVVPAFFRENPVCIPPASLPVHSAVTATHRAFNNAVLLGLIAEVVMLRFGVIEGRGLDGVN